MPARSTTRSNIRTGRYAPPSVGRRNWGTIWCQCPILRNTPRTHLLARQLPLDDTSYWRVTPKWRRSAPPLDLLARALAAGVTQHQVANDLGISRFDLNRALQHEPGRLALHRGAADRSRLRDCCARRPLKNRPGTNCWRRPRTHWPAHWRPGKPPPTGALRRPPSPAPWSERNHRRRRISGSDPARLRGWPGAAEECRTLLRQPSAGG